MTKVCSACGIEKSIEEFDARARNVDGLSGKCKACRQAYEKGWYSKNKIRVRRRKADQMTARRADPISGEVIRAQQRRSWHAGGRDRDRLAKNQLREWHFFQWRAQLWSRRYKVSVTTAQLVGLWMRQRGRCALSGRRLGHDAHLDHMEASIRGGTDTIENLRWLDPMVNVALGSFADDDFIAMCADVTKAQVTA